VIITLENSFRLESVDERHLVFEEAE